MIDFKILIAGILRGLGAISLLLLTSVIALKLGSHQSGKFFFLQAIFLFLVNTCKWGSDIVLCRYLTVPIENKDFSNVVVIISNTILIIFFRFFLIMILFNIISLFEIRLNVCIEYFFALFLQSMIFTMAGVFHAAKKINLYLAYQSIFIPIISALIIFCIEVTNYDQLWKIITYVSLLTFIAIMIHVKFLLSQINFRNFFDFNYSRLVFLFREAVFIGGDQVITAANKHGYIFLIGLYFSANEVTYFTLAQRIAMVASFAIILSNAVLAPTYARFIELKMKDSLISLFYKNIKVCTCCSFILILILIFLSPFISSIYQIPSQLFLSLMLICLFGELINTTTGSSVLVLQMSNKSGVVLISSVIFCSIGFVVAAFAAQTNFYHIALIAALSIAAHNIACYINFRKLVNDF